MKNYPTVSLSSNVVSALQIGWHKIQVPCDLVVQSIDNDNISQEIIEILMQLKSDVRSEINLQRHIFSNEGLGGIFMLSRDEITINISEFIENIEQSFLRLISIVDYLQSYYIYQRSAIGRSLLYVVGYSGANK